MKTVFADNVGGTKSNVTCSKIIIIPSVFYVIISFFI